MVRVCESNIIFPCVCQSICPSICPSSYLLLITTRWNSTRLATLLPLKVRVCESNTSFSVRPSTLSCIHLFVTLSTKQLGGIQPNVLHHFPSWNGCARATLFFYASVRPCGRHLSVTLSHHKPLGGIQPRT